MYHGRATVKNADLSAIFTQAQKKGVSTLKITLRNCLDELLEDGLIWIPNFKPA
jgi:uncharacterized phage-like protein YoqJ